MDSSKRASGPIFKLDFVNIPRSPDENSPHESNHELAGRGAVGLGGSVMVSSRELVDEVLKRPASFSSEDLIEQGNTRPLIPLGIDPPAHVKYRKLLAPLFSPRYIDTLENDIRGRVNHFIDGFIDRGSCDFTAEFAELFPASVFLGMMGLEWDELDTLVEMRDGLLRPGGPDAQPEERSAIQRATAQRVDAYFGRVLEERTATDEGDILSLLLQAEDDGERLTRDEALAICFVLLTAGLDTVTDSLTCFWAFLAQHPDHRRRIVDEPDVIPNAVEELLRWETPVPGVARWAREDATIGGERVKAGHHVMVNLSAANLDPAEFSNPLEVDFDRTVNRHLAFGGGVHRCLGSHLARRELRIALEEWHQRIPEYALADGYRVSYLPPLRFVPDLQLSWRTGTAR